MKNKIGLLISFSLLISLGALAQEPYKQDLVRANKKGKVSVSFGDELVRGSTELPEGDLIQNRLDTRFKRFIKIRKDFIQDVENTKDEFGNR